MTSDQRLSPRLEQARSLRRAGNVEVARQLEEDEIAATAAAGDNIQAIRLLAAGRLAEAERLLRRRLDQLPGDIPALCILGDVAQRAGLFSEAEALFRHALELAPDYIDVQMNLARLSYQQSRPGDALTLYQAVLAAEPAHREAALARLRLLGQIGRYDEAVEGWRALAAQHPGEVAIWVGLGNILKTVGDAECETVFRQALAYDAGAGDAWWGLANLKSARLSPADMAMMQAQLRRLDLPAPSRVQIGFALGKAAEERDDAVTAWRYYEAANKLQHRLLPHDADEVTREVDRSCRFFTPDLFAARSDQGCPEPGPIFVFSMPRSGSTLIEQILASHSQIEGTSELAEIPLSVHRLLARRWQEHLRFPDVLAEVSDEELRASGKAYLEAAALHRHTDKPFFIDKLPNNWAYVGYICLILPNARFIDARRGAMACCFSNYTQYFARGQAFSYDLTDLGRYYHDYVRLMDHLDAAMPKKIIRVRHEHLVEAPELEIRRLLDQIGLPFESACLDFHSNPRAVRTASAEQVRRPLNRAGFDRWRDYAQWLAPLARALGPEVRG